jgi:hypothetical protein
MAIPENDLDRIRLWCREQWPERFWDQVWVDLEVTDRHVDIVEVRPHFGGEGIEIRETIARLRYTATTKLWAIYWCDSNSRFHVYPHTPLSKQVEPLLDHIAESGDPTFWG